MCSELRIAGMLEEKMEYFMVADEIAYVHSSFNVHVEKCTRRAVVDIVITIEWNTGIFIVPH